VSRKTVNGEQLLDLFAAAASYLAASAKAVDAINVYPVPDGDTGSNMSATLREAVDTARLLEPPLTVGVVLAGIARGALYGARGNSGVILSQALRGLAETAAGKADLDGALLTECLRRAAQLAYSAVSSPVEGTMLTVLRLAGEGAAAGGPELEPTLAAAVEAAEEAEAATPEQLPALKEAGVTDAGGEGICVILRGLLAALTGGTPPAPTMPARPVAEMAGHTRETFGYCVEFVVEQAGPAVDPEAVRATAGGEGNRSVVVVGDEAAVHVHAHTDHPDEFIAKAGAHGRVLRVKVDDMRAQNVQFAESGSGAGMLSAALAMSPGPGFDAIFASLGVRVARLDIVKPAAGDIAAAADALQSPDVIVLPNHRNVLMAARQAAGLTRCTLTVVPSKTLPQGIAAALKFDGSQPAAGNAQAMAEAMGSLTTVEVTTAAADRTAEGITVRKGQSIVLVDDTLIGAAEDDMEALLLGLDRAGAGAGALITVYCGESVSEEGLASARDQVAARYPGAELECAAGGQALYGFIASVER
jgi:hypothetical protein